LCRGKKGKRREEGLGKDVSIEEGFNQIGGSICQMRDKGERGDLCRGTPAKVLVEKDQEWLKGPRRRPQQQTSLKKAL